MQLRGHNGSRYLRASALHPWRISDTPSARAGCGWVRLGMATMQLLGMATIVIRPTSYRSKANLLPARQRSRRLGVWVAPR